MGFIFDPETAARHESWFSTETGRIVHRLQTDLILRLVEPRPGERLLDVGCGSGRHLFEFQRLGLDVSGVEPSSALLELARQRLGRRDGLFSAQAEDLPFEDNEFDVVTLINSLEFMDDPGEAISEAIRVAKSRIFIGVLNRWSLTATGRRIKRMFVPTVYKKARFFTPWRLFRLIRARNEKAKIRWATVGMLPLKLSAMASEFESWPRVQGLPFGAFCGMTAHLAYLFRVDPLLLETGLKTRTRTVTASSPTVRGPMDCWNTSTPRFKPCGQASTAGRNGMEFVPNNSEGEVHDEGSHFVGTPDRAKGPLSALRPPVSDQTRKNGPLRRSPKPGR